jgi:hypothetical protein
MTAIGNVSAPAAEAIQAGLAGNTAGVSPTQTAMSGLPPVSLARAASANTVNAELASSQWGVDPASVGGVYGGAAASGGLFSGDSLLPLLTTLTHANAAQALALIGVKTPTPGSGAASTTPAAVNTAYTAAAAANNPSALAQAAASSSAPMVVDPLWGRDA